ncbi:hypothetical protein Sste5346_006015 [Sporothrix stenoceras]|uniref:Uncharacterized protein n=1 Tax=Sporothrix stenoceras TaxID=5173 RepID=A0ABR3Z3Z5_9PEZI
MKAKESLAQANAIWNATEQKKEILDEANVISKEQWVLGGDTSASTRYALTGARYGASPQEKLAHKAADEAALTQARINIGLIPADGAPTAAMPAPAVAAARTHNRQNS